MTVTKNSATHIFVFYYDANGAPYAVKNYDPDTNVWRTYLYVTNLQGDVVRIINPANNGTAVSYEYDAWGRRISKTSCMFSKALVLDLRLIFPNYLLTIF